MVQLHIDFLGTQSFPDRSAYDRWPFILRIGFPDLDLIARLFIRRVMQIADTVLTVGIDDVSVKHIHADQFFRSLQRCSFKAHQDMLIIMTGDIGFQSGILSNQSEISS